MKIFYAGVEHAGFDQKKGKSFEYHNIYSSLKALPGIDVVDFPFEKIFSVGRRAFNEEILERAKAEKPNLFFAFMYSDELEPWMLEELKKHTTTLAWFADDSWRFYNYSKFWAPRFTWAVTTYSWMPELYRKAGQPNAIRSQWAANTADYKPAPRAWAPDVVFVGIKTKLRERIVMNLQKKGIPVEAFGGGWPNGRISEEKMLSLFTNAKINLGLNPPPGYWTEYSIGRLFFRPSMNKIVPDFHMLANLRTFLHQNIRQIKARHFEIPACGGFTITAMADDLDKFYVPGKEIAIYKGDDELARKIRYYLAHESERAAVARAGYERTIHEHTYARRFREIFEMIGLQ